MYAKFREKYGVSRTIYGYINCKLSCKRAGNFNATRLSPEASQTDEHISVKQPRPSDETGKVGAKFSSWIMCHHAPNRQSDREFFAGSESLG